MDSLTQDPDYLKYLEQAKALYKKPQRSNQSKKVYIKKYRICEETGHSKGKCPNQPIVQSNYTRSYFTSLKPIYLQYTLSSSDDSEEDEVTESKQNEKVTMPNLFPKLDDQLLELLSSAMQKKIIDPSTKNKWAESLEYMQCRIKDIIISDGFVNTASECLVMNKTLNEALGWNLGMAPNFSLKHNSNYIMKLGGHKDINTKEEPTSNKKKESQVFDLFTEDLKKNIIDSDKQIDFFLKLEFHSKIQIILGIEIDEFIDVISISEVNGVAVGLRYCQTQDLTLKKINWYINDKNQNDLIKKQFKKEIKELKSKNINLTEYKAKYYSKLKKVNSFQSRIKLLEEELFLTQKYSSKKDSEIMSFKAELVNIKIELDSKVSKLEHLKLEDISISVIGGDSEKNISKSRPEGTNILTHVNDKIVLILESLKIDIEVTSKVSDETIINENNKDNILQLINAKNQFQEIKNVTPIRSHNIIIRRSRELPIIALGASIVNKYQTTPINDKAEYIYKRKKGDKRYISYLKAPYYENIQFSYISLEKISNVKAFSFKQSTAIVFEDLCLASEHIQNQIRQFFENGQHRNISCIFVAQKYHKITTFMYENANYLVLFNSGSSYKDVFKIIHRYTNNVKNTLIVINSYLCKGKFIVFDLDRPEDNPLAIRLRFNTLLNL
ncbi:13324_t:CDS:10 [Cetraspora pellucida]|uniref:13324_t:CDS:1 n=1 Tax=Cetraspora pellucida TaxID=1433469 RepID=A0A9N8VW61_9GLOM|nr:13324_t:CDS:10 [Cetraspora pellucida]